jgi:hypothetical protein
MTRQEHIEHEVNVAMRVQHHQTINKILNLQSHVLVVPMSLFVIDLKSCDDAGGPFLLSWASQISFHFSTGAASPVSLSTDSCIN